MALKSHRLTFVVLPVGGHVSGGALRAFLIRDNWNDFSYVTSFHLIIHDERGTQHNLGTVKIGQFGMAETELSPRIPIEFERLDESFFSLGQNVDYYGTISRLSSDLRVQILTALRDVVADEEVFSKALKERVMKVSLLRFVSPVTVRGQFRRVARGGARVTPYSFEYATPDFKENDLPPIRLTFEVAPDSEPPTNIHVLVGRNGVGKTFLLRQMSKSLVNPEQLGKSGLFSFNSDKALAEQFASLVSVSFSAFDPFEAIDRVRKSRGRIPFTYIGLHRPKTSRGANRPKDLDALADEFVESVVACQLRGKRNPWLHALATLESDPLFLDAGLKFLTNHRDQKELRKRASDLYRVLSAGHKIVLHTLTRLVETVEERTLVLLDEPESHLHAPLLAAFVRAISDLLVHRNGVAIVATHSPVVVQEVPRSCVWKIRRIGTAARAERPEIETFGENLGVLSREVFGHEVTDAGFHKMLETAVKEGLEFDAVSRRFDGQLGAEAQAIVQGLIASRDARERP